MKLIGTSTPLVSGRQRVRISPSAPCRRSSVDESAPFLPGRPHVRPVPAVRWKRSGWIRSTFAKRVGGHTPACSSHAASALEVSGQWRPTSPEN